jgi:hypothetical protein
MHVHYLQEERVLVVTGRAGYQCLATRAICGPGQVVVWPAGPAPVVERRRHGTADDGLVCPAGQRRVLSRGHVRVDEGKRRKAPGAVRRGVSDDPVSNRIRDAGNAEFVRQVLVPIIYVVGLALGKYSKYKDAPPPIASRAA